MAPDAWSPEQYARFRAERRQPFDDLLALVRPSPQMRVVDLGCGSGELTAELHAALGARETTGIDRSPAMLERCREHAAPGLCFTPGDLAAFDGRGLDLVFSNAALQWVPDHPGVLRRLAAALGPGGQLAVQVPANHDHPSHATARELAAEEPFAAALGAAERENRVLAPEEYAVLLDALGFAEQHVRLQVYVHHLAARDEVVEWVRGTALTAYQSRLSPELFERFLALYRERLLPRLEDRRPYVYPFKRILFWARLGDEAPASRDPAAAHGARGG
jgi:trans-aconitate 2-methyltransferase